MSEPVSKEDRDYRWRLSVSRDDWIKLAERLAEDVMYGNFKDACHKEPSQQSKIGALLKIWSTRVDVQRAEQHGAFGASDGTKDDDERDTVWEAFVAKMKPVAPVEPV